MLDVSESRAETGALPLPEVGEVLAALALAFAAIAAIAGGTDTSLMVCARPRRWMTLGEPSPTLFALFRKRLPALTPLDGLKRPAVGD